MLIFNHGSTYFLDKVALTKFINVCRMVWDLIWGTSCFYKSKTEEAKRGGKSAVWPILFCRLSITMVSVPPFSMVWGIKVQMRLQIVVCPILNDIVCFSSLMSRRFTNYGRCCAENCSSSLHIDAFWQYLIQCQFNDCS